MSLNSITGNSVDLVCTSSDTVVNENEESNEDVVSTGDDGVSSSTSTQPSTSEGRSLESESEEVTSSVSTNNSREDAARNDIFAQPLLPPPLSKSTTSPSSSSERKTTTSAPLRRGLSSDKLGSPTKSKPKALSKEKQEKYNSILSSLNYCSPKYGATVADNRYNLEVLKNGAIVDSVRFSPEDKKGYYVIGRVPGCDIVAENPTISRLHAILQFVECTEKNLESTECESSSEEYTEPKETGLYLYDLKSTHGTFINKNQVYPQKFYRVHVGHVIKFGSSQRMYIVNGPSEDEEVESDKSVTELLNEKLKKDLDRKRLEEEEQLKRTPTSKLPRENIEEVGIDWGMGEDADEESDLRINPFAMDYEASELTLDNPKKSLKSWFEREGEDLEYEMREKGNGQYVCRIALPLDGPTDGPVYAESEVKGKKKEAAHDAALKACQILDSHGLLRPSNQESRKRKEKRYEEEDYYSSDDDTFLDRTGSVEKKREKRLRLAGKIEEKVETYESLCTKSSELETEISDLESKIAKSQQMKARADDGEMDIDDYLNVLKTGVFDVKKLRARLREANEELQRTKKLMEITKPVELPSYLQAKPSAATSDQIQRTSSLDVEECTSPKQLEMSAEMKNKPVNTDREAAKSHTSPKSSGAKNDDSNDKPIRKQTVGPMKPSLPSVSKPAPKYGLIMPSDLKEGLLTPKVNSKLPSRNELEDDFGDEEEGAGSSDEDDVQDPQNTTGDPMDEEPEFVPQSKSKRKRQRYRNKPKPKDQSASYDHSDPNYSTWVPPNNQSGDGRTSLNDKLGY